MDVAPACALREQKDILGHLLELAINPLEHPVETLHGFHAVRTLNERWRFSASSGVADCCIGDGFNESELFVKANVHMQL